ncbi:MULTISPECIES: phosphatase PAP2 family protein [Actinomadura]|uniref:Inositol phosphorylceramide synthase n=1 Tax=Actinomadura litoris TaxID=2678616 RepID=A0A7K1LCU0_9ACTN|nr:MULTISPECIES: phosphatase PAP2 family protein [Actinomadura]MBT2214005.1 phosphatase PAP2 family protein [Actinomadura sp. NEAU-AAG7]MUN42250.1 inositol phosphorylceramide synthase [Actinomadura litoris]
MRRWAGEGATLRGDRRVTGLAFAAVLQFLLMAAALGAYAYGRHLADGRPERAYEHARAVWGLERSLFLPDESSLQKGALRWDGWVRAANEYYVRVHFPAITAFMVWVYFWRRRAWPRVRAVILGSAAAALLVHFAYPLAPPRMLPGHGFVDLMTAYGPSAYATEPGQGITNQFAAMPSLHVGWALLIAWGVIRYARGRWRWLAAAHPVVTLLVVVLTANHYWLDGVAGSAIVVAALWATSRIPALDDRDRGRAGASARRDSVGA